MKTHDAVIVGAGPNGLAAALALASPRLKRRLKVAVVDGRDPRMMPTTDTRGTALTLATQTMFEALSVWDQLKPHAQEMRDIIVTDRDGANQGAAPTLLSFTTQDGKPAAASIVENRALLAVLAQAVTDVVGIDLHFGSTVTGFEFGPGLARVMLATGDSLKTSLVIGADGRNSRARHAADISVQEKSYGQSAITFSLSHNLPHGGRAEEHFTSEGVLALLPLPGLQSSIVWALAETHAATLMALTDEEFVTVLRQQVGDHLGDLTLATARQCYPLGRLLATSSIATRLALVGDAAHVIHPLAGLGLNLGFKDAAALADTVMAAAARGQDIGSLAVLEDYARLRRFDTWATAFGLDGMNSLFANRNPLLRAVRSAGLMAVDRVPFIKDALMREAAGMSGDVPRLMRGLQPS
jgi:2-octaprenyl-6-methoxyphenol hydroxylase